MGLGDLTVHSYLDQPFNAEIALIDVGDTPLSGIKVNLAAPEDFDRVGLERVYATNLLTFTVEKNANGHVVVKVGSTERISEPFMPLLVDLAWADGQVYRSYTVLLDPPNYKLNLVKKQLQTIVKRQNESQELSQTGVVNRPVYGEVERIPTVDTVDYRGVSTYGPTVVNETIWQIAQRYKTESILLQQMILAIVGTNPQAFIEGNLNGLKEGSRLQIPASSTAKRVPVVLAKLEVLAHDKAWQTRQAIEHALLPPYIDGSAPHEQERTALGYPLSLSKIPAIFDLTHSSLPQLSDSLLSLGVSSGEQSRVVSIPQVKMNEVDSTHEINLLLSEQLRALQADNKRLQRRLAQREKDLNQLRKRIYLIVERQGMAGQVGPGLGAPKGAHWSWVLLWIGLGAFGGFAYWQLRIRARAESAKEPTIKEEIKSVETVPVMTEPMKVLPVAPQPPGDDLQPSGPFPLGEGTIDVPTLDFEPELPPITQELSEEDLLPEPITEPTINKDKEQEHSIDFVPDPVDIPPTKEVVNPLKSKAALETLLALAKTYIDMGDIVSAKQSLEEVIAFGSESQKLEAKRQLDELNKK